nr:DNA polymerase delta small subunit [Leptinotarsa decemlineata]
MDNPKRVSVDYINNSQKFSSQIQDYNKQYCSIYLARLKEMEILLREKINKVWGSKFPIVKLHKLSEENYEKCVVIGTLFKDQKLKPSILKQLMESSLMASPVLDHFTDESDKLFIEDEMQRFEVLGNIRPQNLVTGITCALLGSDMGKGKFMVEECLFANYRNQVERPLFEDSVFVIFISGIDFINHHNFPINLDLFKYWISGMLGDVDTVSKIARIIIAGNSIRSTPEKRKPTISMISRCTEPTETIEAVKLFDNFLSYLCELVDVDLMPGENDPSNHILPQKEMHHCMFPQSAPFRSLHQVSNPYFCSLNGTKILGTSGQPLRDLSWYSDISDPLEGLEKCLLWNHLAPTAPDTLACFPSYDKDPFIIDDCPHVFFAGNQAGFSTKMAIGDDGQKVRLIAIPEFSKTFQVAVLDLKNLDCTPMIFDKL